MSAIMAPAWDADQVAWRRLVHGSFLWLVVLAINFQKERLYTDSAYYLIQTLDQGWFHVGHGRYSLLLAELPALVGARLGLSVATVILIYSVGHVLWAWAGAWWCQRMGRNELAVGILLLQFIGNTHLYFSPMMEICYGGSIALVLVAWWQRQPLPKGRALLTWAALALLLLTSHPEHAVTYLAITALVWHGAGHPRKVLLLALAPFLVAALLKVLFLTDYEQGKFGNGLERGELRWLDGGYLLQLAHVFARWYPDLFALALLGAWTRWRNGDRWSVLVLTGAMVAVVVMVNTAMDAQVYSRYNESAYFPMVTCGVILGMLAVPKLNAGESRAARLFCLGIVVARTVAIGGLGAQLRERVATLEELCRTCAEQGSAKCIIGANDHAPLYGTWEWSVPMESLLLSKALLGQPVSLVTTEDMDYDTAYAHLTDTMILFRRFEPRSIASMNAELFQVVAGPYVPLDSALVRTVPPKP